MRSRWAFFTVLSGILLAACGNAGEREAETPAAGRPGVTDSEIRVGGLAAVTNPLGQPYASIFDGVQAYFDTINEQGGVFGRRIRIVARRDDHSIPVEDVVQARALVEQDKVFAVIPVATHVFAGGKYLAENNVPTFGWNINAEWSLGPSLFGEKGSYLCFDCADPYLPFLASKVGAKKVGILAYTAIQSKECAEGQKNSYDKYGMDVVFEDSSLPFGFTDLSADIARMRRSGVEFVSTCMDANGNARLSKAIRQAGLDITQYWPNGYDLKFVGEFADEMEGIYLSSLVLPFEAADASPSMGLFLQRMKAAGKEVNEHALAGWIVADLFVTGLKAAGPDFTRQTLVEAINKITDYRAGGLVPGLDWTRVHTGITDLSCVAYITVRAGSFVPVFGKPGKPFVCLDNRASTLPTEPVEYR